MDRGELVLISCRNGQQMAASIADYLGVELCPVAIKNFKNGEVLPQIGKNIRGRDVFIFQQTESPADLVELCTMIDAAVWASANRITAVTPNLYGERQDKRDKPRVPITANLTLRLLSAAGAHRALAMQLHSPQIQGMTDPRCLILDEIYGSVELVNKYLELYPETNHTNTIVLPCDAGSQNLAKYYAKALKVPRLSAGKERGLDGKVAKTTIHGSDKITGKRILVIDDIFDTCDTLASLVREAMNYKPIEAIPVGTHGFFTDNATQKLDELPIISKVLIGNTVKLSAEVLKNPKVIAIEMAETFAKAINAIHCDESVSELDIFRDE